MTHLLLFLICKSFHTLSGDYLVAEEIDKKDKNMKKLNKNFKVFICTLFSFSFLIVLLCGLIITEKSCRYVGFGEASPLFVCEHKKLKPTYLRVHFMGKDYVWLSAGKSEILHLENKKSQYR